MLYWRKIGEIGVDSGTVVIADPGYLDAWNPNRNQPRNSFANMMDGRLTNSGLLRFYAGFGIDPAGNQDAVACSTLYGDGTYRVFALVGEAGEPYAVLVDFLGALTETWPVGKPDEIAIAEKRIADREAAFTRQIATMEEALTYLNRVLATYEQERTEAEADE